MAYEINSANTIINGSIAIGLTGQNFDLKQAELITPVIDNASTAPATPVEGQMYYNTTDKLLYFWSTVNGTAAWIPIKDYTQSANLPTHASRHKAGGNDTINLNELGLPTDSVAMNGKKITGLGTPNDPTDAATMGYVDSVKQGLYYKDAVKYATNGPLPTNSLVGNVLSASAVGVWTIDGGSLTVDDRILVKDEVAGANNGIYTVTTVGTTGAKTVLTRAKDCDVASEVRGGMCCWVDQGAVNADTQWWLETNDTITWGTTALSFIRNFKAADISAGDGLSKTSNTLSVKTADQSIFVDGNGIKVKPSSTASKPTIEYDSTASTGGIAVKHDGTLQKTTSGLSLASAYTSKSCKTTVNVIASSQSPSHSLGVTPDDVQFYTSLGMPIIFEITGKSNTTVSFTSTKAISGVIMTCRTVGS